MSEMINRRVVTMLRADMYPSLPPDIQALFDTVTDYLGTGPNIVTGTLQERGAGAKLPGIYVDSKFVFEALTSRQYAHVTLNTDIWVDQPVAGSVDGRRVIGILDEYTSRALQDTNWSGNDGDGFISVKRCYEVERSPVMFDPEKKLYHLMNTYRAEATSPAKWY